MHESTNTIDFQYVDTDFGDASLNNGASATSGVENASGTVGAQNSFNQTALASGSAIACAQGLPATSAASATAPPAITITTTSPLPAGFSFTVQASDRTSTGSKAFTLKINKK